MAPVGTVWGDLRQRQTKVILSVAALNELELTKPEFSFQNKPSEFVSKFPYGKIPAFEDPEGWKLIEGATIARYLSEIGEAQLLGSSVKETALIDQWVHFAEHEVFGPVQNATAVVFGFSGPFNRETLDKHNERLARALTYLESYLETRSSEYLVSDKITLADIVLAGVIYSAARVSLGVVERTKYKHTLAHFAKVTGDERIKQFWGTEGFIDVPITEPKTFSL